MKGVPTWLKAIGIGISGLGVVVRIQQMNKAERKREIGVPWGDLTASETARREGIANRPGAREREALEALYRRVLVPISLVVGDYRITSAFRSPELNAAVGGAAGSQHMRGEAADLAFAEIPGMEAARRIHESGLEVDQVIVYATSGHVHVSYTTRRRNRRAFRLDHEDGSPLARLPFDDDDLGPVAA